MSLITTGTILVALRAAGDQYPHWRRQLSASSGIILDHCCIAGASGLIPIPLASQVVMLGGQVVMYGRINKEFGLTLSKNTMKVLGKFMLSQIAGLIAAFPIMFVGSLAGSLLKLIPGVGSIAGGISDAAVNASITYVLGVVYVEALGKTIEKGNGVNIDKLKTSIETEFRDKNRIKELYKEGRRATSKMDFASRSKEAQELAKNS